MRYHRQTPIVRVMSGAVFTTVAEQVRAELGTPMEGLAQLTPRLKEPSWPRLIGQQAPAPAVSLADVTATKQERLKAAKRRHRIETLLSGRFVRTRRATAA